MSINTSIVCNQPLLFNVKQHVSACNWPSSGLCFSLKRKYILGVGKGAEISTRLSPLSILRRSWIQMACEVVAYVQGLMVLMVSGFYLDRSLYWRIGASGVSRVCCVVL
jgi:hypothetical protein